MNTNSNFKGGTNNGGRSVLHYDNASKKVLVGLSGISNIITTILLYQTAKEGIIKKPTVMVGFLYWRYVVDDVKTIARKV